MRSRWQVRNHILGLRFNLPNLDTRYVMNNTRRRAARIHGSGFAVEPALKAPVIVVTLAAHLPIMHFIDFRDLQSRRDIAKYLGCPIEVIGTISRDFLTQHRIPKRNKGFREAWEVSSSIHKESLRNLAAGLDDFACHVLEDFPSQSAHGFVRRRSIVSNARAHIGMHRLLNADIRDFFHSIRRERVVRTFVDMGMTADVATCLADFCCLDGALPLGYPTSPLIANIVCHELDSELEVLAKHYGAIYTRYADDLTFSSKAGLPSRIEIASILEPEGFELHTQKYRVKTRGQAFFVTGLSVSDFRPRVPKKWKRRLCQEIFYAEKYGLKSHLMKAGYNSFQSGINKISGRIKFLNSVEPTLAAGLLARWNDLLEAANESSIYLSRKAAQSRKVSLFIDESMLERNGNCVFMVALTAIEDVTFLENMLNQLRQELIADPFIPGRKSKLRDKGLHWVDLAQDVRARVVGSVSDLPFRTFVAFKKYDRSQDFDFATEYTRLFRELLRSRYISLDGADVDVVFENHSQLKTHALQQVSDDLYAESRKRKARAPRQPPVVRSGAKLDEPCLAISDILLGAFGDYATAGKVDENSVKVETSRFERLRSKYKLVTEYLPLGRTNNWTVRRPFVSW